MRSCSIILSAIVCCVALVAGESADERDLLYGIADGQELRLNVYRPGATGVRPGLVLIHGGAWSAGDRSEWQQIAPMLTAQGYVLFAIGYRLVTDTGNRWPAQLQDAARAMRWVRAHAARFAVDPQRIGAIGGSAGGHIVACLGIGPEPREEDPALAGVSSRPTCIVNMCGPSDLSESYVGQVVQGEWTDQQIARLLGGPPAHRPDLARSASPLLQVAAGAPPVLLIQGRNDELVPWRQAEAYATALRKVGAEAELLLHDGGHDMGDTVTTLRCMIALNGFLRRHLHP
ncbi:MAG: alpha/beta hydrolase [Planctomycetes bacterium]|nr:alpha/beta hydrolase [Planctomycetota bacterium]